MAFMCPSCLVPTITVVETLSARTHRGAPRLNAVTTPDEQALGGSRLPVSGRRPWWNGPMGFVVSRWPWSGVVAAALLSAALRIPFVAAPAHPDEGGYLIAAQHWHGGGAQLYGSFFVDRPPLLMLFWRAVYADGGILTARWAACLLVAVLVICAGWAGQLIGGDRGAVWSALTAAALASSPLLGAQEVDGELLAVPLVMASCAMALMAVRCPHPGAQARWAALVGVTGAGAVLMKQNFFDALVFALVLIVTSALTGSLPRRTAARLLGWGAAGAAAAATVTLIWAATTVPGLSGLWYAMYGFRSSANQVIFSHSLTAPLSRLVGLVVAGITSGAFVVVVLYVALSWSRVRRRDPVSVAVLAMLLVGLVGVGLGASYWTHYLIGLIPVLALAAGTFGERTLPIRRLASAAVAFVVVSAVATGAAATARTSPTDLTERSLERVLAGASHRSDSLVITYGHANVLETSGLKPGYPYLWSLPTRTLDPRLHKLIRNLSGPSAPTWLVEWEDFNSWGIDPGGRLASLVGRRYHQVASVCDVELYLHNHVHRALPVVVDPCAN